jgi:hypothetical protein
MNSSSKRNGWMVAAVVGALLVAWLTWAWSPAREEPSAPPTPDAPVALAPQISAPSPKPERAPVPDPEPAAPTTTYAPNPDPNPEITPPERIPTPHPMSLDQTRPPEAFGALSELKHQYESESRGATSAAAEAHLRELTTQVNIPKELVQDISCRRKLCKIDMHWLPRRRIGFSVVVESLKNMYERRVAVEPALEKSDDGTYVTHVYVMLKP